MKEDTLKTESDWICEVAKALAETVEAIITGKEESPPPANFIAAMTGPLFVSSDE